MGVAGRREAASEGSFLPFHLVCVSWIESECLLLLLWWWFLDFLVLA